MSDIPCSNCGAIAWKDSWASGDFVVGARKPLSIVPGEALCHRCWSKHWDEIARSHVGTLRRSAAFDQPYRPDDLFDRASNAVDDLGFLFGPLDEHDSSLAMSCRDCYEAEVDPGEILCAMCAYDHKRKRRSTA